MKLSTLQRRPELGGWGIPNFELYFCAITLRALYNWFNQDSDPRVAWLPIESSIALPHRLQDLVFANVPHKHAFDRFGPIVAHLLAVWRHILAGLTAAKRMVAQRWKAPHLLPHHQWLAATVDIANLESSVARRHGAKEANVKSWLSFTEALQS